MPLSVTVKRVGYRLAYRLLQVAWWLTRPRTRGVKCVLTDHEQILLVRHTYGSRAWDLPGGLLKRGETPLSAARREMEEELGMGGAQWRSLGELEGRVNLRHDTIYIYRAEVADPALRVDPGELQTAAWFSHDALPGDLGPYVLPIVSVVAPDTGASATS
jgi:8-oxo-dGTP pyrophosphatase MutT (NUDIX family)